MRVRFLHVQQRTVEQCRGGEYVPVDSLDLGDASYLPWDEAVVHETTSTLSCPGHSWSQDTDIEVDGASETELLHGPDGQPAGRLVRRREGLRATLTVTSEPMPGPYGVRRVRFRLTNTGDWQPAGRDQRQAALRHALVAAHLLIDVAGGAFVSLLDPPEWARGYAERCEQVGAFPVLAGPPGDRRLLLASPIILYDHPQVAPESVSQFCDGTEMDEMLTLRTSTLTEQEKRQVRGSDPRAAALLDEVDSLPADLLERLHGAIRGMTSLAKPTGPVPDEWTPWWDPATDGSVDPDTDLVLVEGVPISRGSPVRLRPGSRRADAHDMFLDGRTATVQAVLSDVDGGIPPGCDLGRTGRARPGRTQPARPVPLLRTRRGRADPGGFVMRTLIAGLGNIFEGDDGFGVAVARQLMETDWPAGVEVRDFGIRGVHLAYQLLDGYDLVVIVDAASREGEPGTLYVIDHAADGVPAPLLDAHDLGPDGVLALVPTLGGTLGRVVVVGCEPASLAPQWGLSPAVAAGVDAAAALVRDIVQRAGGTVPVAGLEIGGRQC